MNPPWLKKSLTDEYSDLFDTGNLLVTSGM